MGADHFTEPEAKAVAAELDVLARARSTRAAVFADFLRMAAAALSGGRAEDVYMEAVKRYLDPDGGERGCDRIARLFGRVVGWYTLNPFGDLLGDVFQGGVTFGEHGQFFTPASLCDTMARMTFVPPADGQPPLRVADPACGSGRTLLAFARLHPAGYYFGTDVDGRCADMAAINLALAGCRGAVVHGNTLAMTARGGWRVGFDGVGFLRPMDRAEAEGLLAGPFANAVPPPAPPAGVDPPPAPAKRRSKKAAGDPGLFDGLPEDGP